MALMDPSVDTGSEVPLDLSRATDAELKSEIAKRREAKRRDLQEQFEHHVSYISAIMRGQQCGAFLAAFAPEHSAKCNDDDHDIYFKCARCTLLDVLNGYDPPMGTFFKLEMVDKSEQLK